MVSALQQALQCEVSREELRALVELYSASEWGLGHKRAVIRAVASTEQPDRDGARGVVYVAFGGPARECAEHAMQTFKHHMVGWQVALVSDKPLGLEDVFIAAEDVDIGARWAKTKLYDLAPAEWEYVMYLDADTEVVADVSFLAEPLMDGWDMVICRNPAKFHIGWEMRRRDNADECLETFDLLGTGEVLQLNGGVWCIRRNERTRAFMEAWHSEWQRYGKRDQGALLRALWKHPVKLYVLGNEWNTVTRYMDAADSAGILHYPMTARRWRGKVTARSDSAEAWRRVRQWEKDHGK
jgi:hypothetical protein